MKLYVVEGRVSPDRMGRTPKGVEPSCTCCDLGPFGGWRHLGTVGMGPGEQLQIEV